MARKSSLMIIGCGDVGLRVLKLLAGRWRICALTSSAERVAELRAAGAVPLVGNLDIPASLGRLGGGFDAVLHLAPPLSSGTRDPRTRNLLQALARRGAPSTIVYASTTGVYGDCGGAHVDETRTINPQTDRAKRRVDAENQLRMFGRRFGTNVHILRIPGIYAGDRAGGHPRERLKRGTPVLMREDDVYTNHIHADDLARACVLALWRGLPQRVVNACDSTDMLMGDYFDLAADIEGLPRPPRVSRAEAQRVMPAVSMSFLSESRRLSNQRLLRELGLVLRYPTVKEGL